MKVLLLKKDSGGHSPPDLFAGGWKGNAIWAPGGTKVSGSSDTGVVSGGPQAKQS